MHSCTNTYTRAAQEVNSTALLRSQQTFIKDCRLFQHPPPQTYYSCRNFVSAVEIPRNVFPLYTLSFLFLSDDVSGHHHEPHRRRRHLPVPPILKLAAAIAAAGQVRVPLRCPGSDSIEKNLGLSFGLKNGLRFNFDCETRLNYPFLNIFLV